MGGLLFRSLIVGANLYFAWDGPYPALSGFVAGACLICTINAAVDWWVARK